MLDQFLNAQKAAREERALEKKKEQAITLIQATVRGFIARRKYRNRVLKDLEDLLPGTSTEDGELQPSIQVFLVVSRYLAITASKTEDSGPSLEKFERVCKYLIRSVETCDSAKFSYIGVALNKKYSLDWIRHIKILLSRCLRVMEVLKPESHPHSISLALQLHTLVVFTSPNTWLLLQKNKQLAPLLPGMNQMCANILGALVQSGFYPTLKTVLFKGICRNNVCLKPVSLVAILSLSTRPLISGGFTDNLMTQFILHMLTVPALIHQIETLTPDYMSKLADIELLSKCIKLLSKEEAIQGIISSVQGTQILALLANLVHLFNAEPVQRAVELGFPDFTVRLQIPFFVLLSNRTFVNSSLWSQSSFKA